ncbi:MAG TPA: hypothetical protein DD381_09685 [Lentisphaeria bacterium]|nr:MAG: hypothetical protein A2X47_07560 [Lentisphaerae bacterium GWF2_38_69]HBM16595.1 hypothetical protein [Lentisphaeria bacterium]
MGKVSLFSFLLVLIILLTGCEKQPDDKTASGYIDADYVYISAPSSEKIIEMYAVKGSIIKTGDKLFEMDNHKSFSMHEANKFMDMALQSFVTDMKKGARQEQIDEWKYINYAVKEMIIFLKLETEMFRFLSEKQAAADQYWWFTRQMQYALIAISKAIDTHQKYIELGQREDKINAFEMADNAVKSMLPYTKYQFTEAVQFSPYDAIVFDIFYRKGELPGAGKPVIMLLPDENLKVVFYISGLKIDTIKLGEKVKVFLSRDKNNFIEGQVNYISQNIQYTDPLIYSLKNDKKLIYKIEAKINPKDKLKAHPGEVVSVEF